MNKILLCSSMCLGALLITGCSEIGSFPNDFEVIRSGASSPVNSAIDPTTQNNIPFEKTPPSTPESRLESLASTVEGFMLFLGWEDAAYYEYDVSLLSKEEKESFILEGLDTLLKRVDDEEFSEFSCINSELLARYYLLKKDTKKKLYWAFKSAEKGSSFCMRILSDAYRGGDGVVQDFEEGFKWSYLSAATGDESCKKWVKETNEACIKYPLVSEKLSPMIKEAKKRANQWMQEHPEIFISSE